MAIRKRVVLRDLIVFQVKLLLDGLKDLVLVQLSIGAAILDLLFGARWKRPLFYRVVSLSERFDAWLNLNGAARSAHLNPDGLFGESRAGSDSLLGRLEEMVRGKEELQPRSRAV